MQDFGELLGAKLVSQLFKTCLQTLILERSGGDKEKALQDVKQLRELRYNLSQLDFEISTESELLLEEFESNFDGLFMNQLREDVLAKIRQLIKADVHQTVQISPEDISSNESLTPKKLLRSTGTLSFNNSTKSVPQCVKSSRFLLTITPNILTTQY
jgi:hypothetical protein